MKPTLVMLVTVAVVVILTAIAAHVWTDRQSHPYLIGVGLAGGAALAYAGLRWKRDTQNLRWKRDTQNS